VQRGRWGTTRCASASPKQQQQQHQLVCSRAVCVLLHVLQQQPPSLLSLCSRLCVARGAPVTFVCQDVMAVGVNAAIVHQQRWWWLCECHCGGRRQTLQ
jgi:hypothetical protein